MRVSNVSRVLLSTRTCCSACCASCCATRGAAAGRARTARAVTQSNWVVRRFSNDTIAGTSRFRQSACRIVDQKFVFDVVLNQRQTSEAPIIYGALNCFVSNTEHDGAWFNPPGERLKLWYRQGNGLTSHNFDYIQ